MSINRTSALSAAEDLIALAEYAYEEHADMDDAPLEAAACPTADGLCGWRVCRATGCVIDKYHRGLALQTEALCDSDRSGEAGETRRDSTEGESAGPKGIAQ